MKGGRYCGSGKTRKSGKVEDNSKMKMGIFGACVAFVLLSGCETAYVKKMLFRKKFKIIKVFHSLKIIYGFGENQLRVE